MTTEEPVVVAEVAAQAIEAAATVVMEKEPAEEGKKTSAKRKTRIPSLHPPYFDMIKDAISSLKDRTGSSQYAIAKFVEQKQKNLPVRFKTVLLIQLRRLVAVGKLIKIKASYKLPPAVKKKPTAKPKPAAKKAPVKKPATKPKPVPKAKAAAKPKLVTKAKVVPPQAGETLAYKTNPKRPTKPAKVARTSTRGKKPATAEKPFRVTKRSMLPKVSSVIAKLPVKKATLKNVKTNAATPKKSAATRKRKK